MKLWGLGLAGAVTVAIGARAMGAIAPPPHGSVKDAIQVLADLTAIDVDCRDLAVNFGVGFQYAEQLGLAPSSVMPAGARRPAFEAALHQTQSSYGAVIECGTLARHYSIALPGSVTFQPPGRDGS
jgi:hypothetical protein